MSPDSRKLQESALKHRSYKGFFSGARGRRIKHFKIAGSHGSSNMSMVYSSV